VTPPYGLVQLHKKNFLPLARKRGEEEKREGREQGKVAARPLGRSNFSHRCRTQGITHKTQGRPDVEVSKPFSGPLTRDWRELGRREIQKGARAREIRLGQIEVLQLFVRNFL